MDDYDFIYGIIETDEFDHSNCDLDKLREKIKTKELDYPHIIKFLRLCRDFYPASKRRKELNKKLLDRKSFKYDSDFVIYLLMERACHLKHIKKSINAAKLKTILVKREIDLKKIIPFLKLFKIQISPAYYSS